MSRKDSLIGGKKRHSSVPTKMLGFKKSKHESKGLMHKACTKFEREFYDSNLLKLLTVDWLGDEDSNLSSRVQSPLSCR